MKKDLIVSYEERLRQAMLQSDVSALDELIHDDLAFVNHFGHILTKTDDLEAHRSGVMNFTHIEFLEQKITILESTAITITRAALRGNAGGNPIQEEMCYTRIWLINADKAKVISGHCSLVQS